MISFQTTGIDFKLEKCDTINISSHITNEKLDYIFKNYIFYKEATTLSEGWVKYSYGMRTDKFDEFVNDSTLGSTLKTLLIYHFILEELNSSNIYIVTNIDKPNIVHVYFDQAVTEGASFSGIFNVDKNRELVTEYMFAVGKLWYNSFELSSFTQDYAYKSKFKKVSKLTDNFIVIANKAVSEADKNLAYEHLVVKTVDITDKNKTTSQLSIFKEDMKVADRFAFRLKLLDTVSYIFFENNYNYYVFSNRLREMFDALDSALHDSLWKYEEISYMYYNGKLPTFDKDFGVTNELKQTVNCKVNITNTYLKSHIVPKFFAGNELTTDEVMFDINFNHMTDAIVRYVDEIGKGIAYFDYDSSYINATIGDPDDFNIFTIYGYDQQNLRPIILAVSEDFESAGSLFRQIKIYSGGITAINNDELTNKILATGVTQLMSMLLVDVASFEHTDFIGMFSSVYGIAPTTMPYVFDKFIDLNDTETTIFYDDKVIDAKGRDFSVLIYKHKTSPVLLNANDSFVNEDLDEVPTKRNKAIPYDAIVELYTTVTNVSQYDAFIEKYFVTDPTFVDDPVNYEYNNMYIKYIPILSAEGIHYISNKNSVIGFRTINEVLLREISDNVKKNLNMELFNNTLTMDIYNVVKGSDLVATINDDSEFDDNSEWYMEIFTNGVDILEEHDLSDAVQSEFLTMLIHENMYHTNLEFPSGTYACAVFDLKDIKNKSFNNSIVFNKVIGTDLYSYFSLKASGNDITFSGYFISSYTDNKYALYLLDLDNAKIKNLATTPFEFNCGTANPIITNIEVIENNKIFVIDKNQYDTIVANWYNIFKIYDVVNGNIVYSRKPFDISSNKVFNIYSNELAIVK